MTFVVNELKCLPQPNSTITPPNHYYYYYCPAP